ncbi:hypothetical protein A2W24_02260 [Microgenomates group bacterium RBG_16_45_19]|nr:MAG: hypothetical protein A2W24_02260 [Microgenomates group bacterium RBG_16_45_19]
MPVSPSKLAHQFFASLYTTADVKAVSDQLEALSQNQTFKVHAHRIVTDSQLTDNQKGTQLLYLLRQIDQPLLYDFFSDLISAHHIWLFHHDKIDYFDKFVQAFQQVIDTCPVFYLTTATPLHPSDYPALIQKIKTGLGLRVLLQTNVNPALIGGVQVKLENYLYDVSIRSKLNQFQAQWLKTLDESDSLVGHHDPG